MPREKAQVAETHEAESTDANRPQALASCRASRGDRACLAFVLADALFEHPHDHARPIRVCGLAAFVGGIGAATMVEAVPL